MHSIQRADYDRPAQEDNINACHATSLYNCLHADDFSTNHAKRRRASEPIEMPSLQRARVARFGEDDASPNVLVSEPQGVSGAAASHSGAVRRLQGVTVQFHGLPDPLSNVQIQARECAGVVIRSCLQATWEPSTVARYNAVLEGAVAEAEALFGVELLPCDTDIKLMLLFSRFDGAPWGTISVSKCAVRAWHAERGLTDVFQSVWSERTLFFWKGLKKRADHTRRHAKRPIYHKELLCFQRARLDAGTVAGIRDAAIAAVCFYCIRSPAETLSLQVGDISVAGDSFKIVVRRQENDPEGRGMTCWLPKIESLGVLCPFHLLSTWVVA